MFFAVSYKKINVAEVSIKTVTVKETYFKASKLRLAARS
jgi:hypothetical protein